MELWRAIPLFGSLVNCLTVIIGSLIGYALRSHIPPRVMELPEKCLGLITLVIALGMAMKTEQILIVIFSLCVGSIIGGLLRIEDRTNAAVQSLQDRLKRFGSNFSEAFMTSSLIFCIGSMTILGGIEEGLGQYPSLYLTKAMMDGLMSIAFSATRGFGVILSAGTVLIVQGSLTLAARLVQSCLTPAATTELTATGGIMLLGIGFNILGLTRLKMMDSLPALIFAVILARIFL